jgi:flagellar protein FlaG
MKISDMDYTNNWEVEMNAIQNITQTSENLTNDLMTIINSYNEQNFNETNFQKIESKENNKQFDEKEIKKMTENLNNAAASLNFSLNFQIHKKTGKLFVKVIDKNTHKVIKEIPSKSLLDFLSKFEEAVGALFDDKT